MAVEKKEYYRQKDGQGIIKVYTKPTKKFPEGANYFYVDTEDEDIVDSYSWNLSQSGKLTIVVASYNMLGYRTTYIHQELAHKHLSYYPNCIDHISGVDIDNVDSNLNVVTQQQNIFNKSARGYSFDKHRNSFQPQICFNGNILHPFGSVKTEVEACQLAHLVETDYLKSLMKDEYYMYDFLEDRRNDLDILDLERTGIISHEESVYRHVLKYAGNAWYYYRYGLQEYFKDNKIPVPAFALDANGLMVDNITGQKLCLAPNGVASVFTHEEVDAAYEEEMIALHKASIAIKKADASRANSKKATEGARAKGSYNQALILKSVLKGTSKTDIEYSLGFSRATIDRALRGLTKEAMENIWNKYRATAFNGVDVRFYNMFLHCGCSYKQYQQKLQFESEVAFNIERL